MSNYHITTGLDDGNSFTVVFHIPVPGENNAAGINLRAAISTEQGTVTSQVKNLDAGEQTQLNDGEIFEYVEVFHTNPGETLAQKRNKIDTRYSNLIAPVQNRLRERFAYWGFSRNVP